MTWIKFVLMLYFFMVAHKAACHTLSNCPLTDTVLNCPQTDTEDDHPILPTEVEAAVQLLKKGKSAEVDNIPAELVQAGGEDVITALTTICNKIWQTGEWPTPWTQSLVITFPKKATCSSARTTEQ